MIFAYDPTCVLHETGDHPERKERLTKTMAHLERVRPELLAERRTFPRASEEDLARVHEPEHVARVKRIAAEGGGGDDAETIVSARRFDAALAAAGQAVGAALAVCRGPSRTAFCAVRPPGHHATPDAAMGFCLFNNVAIAARAAKAALGLERVAIVDFDVHHGNGTQDTFYADPSVFYLSLHRYPFYPGTGLRDERGAGAGVGTTLNFPLPSWTPPKEYHAAYETGLAAVREFRPELLILSAGFDAYEWDPLGGLNLRRDDFRVLTERARELAAAVCGGRLVSVLEGGYHIAALPELVEAHLDALE